MSKEATSGTGAAVVALLGMSWAAAVSAQNPKPYPLGEVIVSAQRPVSEAAAAVRTVTPADIRAYGARTLDEALTMLPGVEVRTGTGGVPRVNVRGFRSRHIVLLLDGIPLNSTFDGQADPSFIPVEQIAAIKWRAGDAWLGRGSVSGGGHGLDFFVSASASESAGVGLLAAGDDGRVVHRAGWGWPDTFAGEQSIAEVRARGVDEVREVRTERVVDTGLVDVGKHLRPSYRERLVCFTCSAWGRKGKRAGTP